MLFRPFRGTASQLNQTTIAAFARLDKLVAEGRVPKGVAFILTAGNLTALNKVDAAKNDQLFCEGKSPLVRPVNGGAMILKESLQNAVQSESGKRVKAELLPIQDVQLARRN